MANINKKILFYVLVIIFSFSKEILTDNIIKIINDKKYPIVIFNNTWSYINIITSNRVFIFDKKINLVDNIAITTFSPPYFICIDQSNNHFLAENLKYYSISINTQFKVDGYNYLNNLPEDFQRLGYIQAGSFDKSGKFGGCRCNVDKNEIIIYGKKDSYICFYFISQQKMYQEKIEGLDSKISCKLIKDVKYICVYIKNSETIISGFVHLYSILMEKKISKVLAKKIDILKNFADYFIYDISGNDKIIFAINNHKEIK